MIPKFGGVTGNMPRGVHVATWVEMEKALGFSARRRDLLVGLLAACQNLRNAGATRVYIDGTFATKKHNPGDWDACYDVAGVDASKVDPTLLDFTDKRSAMKKKYLGEMLPANALSSVFGEPYLTFFQHHKNGRPKGIVEVDLRTLPS